MVERKSSNRSNAQERKREKNRERRHRIPLFSEDGATAGKIVEGERFSKNRAKEVNERMLFAQSRLLDITSQEILLELTRNVSIGLGDGALDRRIIDNSQITGAQVYNAVRDGIQGWATSINPKSKE